MNMKHNTTTSLEKILNGYVPMDQLPGLVLEIRSYYLELIATELAEAKTASRLRQKIVRS